MTEEQWKYFCDFKNDLRNKIEEWKNAAPELPRLQKEAAQLAKKATFRSIKIRNSDARYAQLEQELLDEINKMNIGPAGLGGKTTALSVNIETYPTHIAGMPVAVNICCHACRHKSVEI